MRTQSPEVGLSDTGRGLIPNDLLAFSWLQEIAISPNGWHVAYTVRRPDVTQNGYQVQFYLLDLRTRTPRKITTGIAQASSPAWSRDGSRLAFVVQTKRQTTIRIVAPDGTGIQSYTINGGTPMELDWSPDGQRLAFARWTYVRRATDRRRSSSIPAPSVRVIRRLRYKQDGVGWVHDQYRHIWVLECRSGDCVQLTAGECDYKQPRWNWAGQRIAFTAVAREQNTLLGQGQICVCTYPGGRIQPLMTDWEGSAVSPQWRSDDRVIVFAGYRGTPPVNRRRFYSVWRYDRKRERVRNLTADIDQTVGNYAFSDQRPGLTNVTVTWPGGRGPIYFLLTEQGATHLCSVTEAERLRQEVGGHCVVFNYSPSCHGHLAYGRAAPDSPGELHLLSDSRHEQLTCLNPWISSPQLATPREYWYDGLDNTPVHAWEVTPIGFEKNGRYPAIVYVHCSMFSWDFSFDIQCLANAGYAITYFNQRGTTAGYGQEHALGNYYGKHRDEYEEIMRGVEDFATRPYVDDSRLGVTGGSCGGFMTNWIIGHTDRFRAAVTQRSISDLVSKFGTSDNGPEQALSEGGGAPWMSSSRLWNSSPIAYVDEIKTPLLILHSEEDYRCALSQAEELFAALRWKGHDVKLVVFEGEDHGLSYRGRPGNRIERILQIVSWFQTHLQDRRTTLQGSEK